MGSEQRRQPRRIAARHPALGRNSVDTHVPPRGRETRRIAGRVVVVDEPEIEFGIAAELEPLERRVIGIVGAPFSAPADGRTGSAA